MRLDKQIPPEELAALVKYTEIIEQHGDDMLNLCVELCDNNSGTYNLPGIESVAQILEREFSCLGEPIHRHAVEPLRDIDSNGVLVEIQLGPLLQIIKRPHVRPRVLLCIHMDTVYGIDHPFQKCRTLENGNVNGPGVADAKGGLVVMLHALRAFEASPLAEKIGWEVVINPDEELGSPGSADFLMQRASEADVGLLFEPSLPDGTLVSARKGVGNFCFVVRGKSVHSGREFKKGRNAVVKCCEIMQRVHSLNVTNDVTLNVGRVNGGAALNVVPDLALGRINVRVNTKANMEVVEQQLKSLAKEFDAQEGFSVEVFGKFTSPPKEVTQPLQDLKARIEDCGNALGRQIRWRDTGGASDGNKFAAAGLPNVDTLGPCGADIHSSDEYLIPSTMVDSARLTALILHNLAAMSD